MAKKKDLFPVPTSNRPVAEAREPSPNVGVFSDPDRRIKTAGDARNLYNQLFLENDLRSQTLAQVRNQIEGGRPFDPQKLHQAGEDWRSNVNFRDAEAKLLRVFLPFWKMVHEVPRKVAISVHEDSPDADKWGIAMAEAFDLFLEDWADDYFQQFMGFTRDYVEFGPGYVMWPDKRTPRFEWMSALQMYFPRRTKANVDRWELVAVRSEMTASQLWDQIATDADRKASKEAGWNHGAVEQAIALCGEVGSQRVHFDLNYYQDMITANDLVISSVWPPIEVVHVWSRRRDGKICHQIITERSDCEDFLYEDENAAENFRQAFGAVFYEVGTNCLLHTIKGWGVKNYHYMTAINRHKCRILDASAFAMGMNFQRGQETPDEAPPVEQYSMINLFPPGLTQFQYFPQVQQAQSVTQMLEQNEAENNYIYSEMQESIAATKTAKQALILANIQQEMTTATASIYLSQVGRIFAECVRRLRENKSDADSKKFWERATKRGCPEAVLSKSEITVKTGASPSMASPAVRAQIAGDLMQTVYPLPDANRRQILEFKVANLTGSEGVKNFLLPVGTNSDPRARREAMIENAQFGQGMSLPVDPSDAHVEHAEEHLKAMEPIAIAIKTGQTVTPDHMILAQVGLPHTGQHLKFIESDETKRVQFKALNAAYKQVMAIVQGAITRLAKAKQSGAAPDQIRAQMQQGPQ